VRQATEIKAKRTFWALLIAIIGSFGQQSIAQPLNNPTDEQRAASVALILVGDGEGVVTKVAPAIAVREDGVFFVAYHAIKDAKELQLRLKSGEIFDDVVQLGRDERRDVAAIRVQASGLAVLSPASPDEIKPGQSGTLYFHSLKKLWSIESATINDFRLADEIPGAGEGFRVIQFTGGTDKLTESGILFGPNGNLLGIVTNMNAAHNGGFAVPIGNVLALAKTERTKGFSSGVNLKVPSESTFLAANNPSTDPKDLLLSSKTVYVDSDSLMFKEHQLVNELNKRKEIKDWGWVIVTGAWDVRNKADLIIELDHQALTFDFTYTLRHRKSSILISSGKVIIADGASGASIMVDKIIKNTSKILNPVPPKGK
jgi:hypothetical protein